MEPLTLAPPTPQSGQCVPVTQDSPFQSSGQKSGAVVTTHTSMVVLMSMAKQWVYLWKVEIQWIVDFDDTSVLVFSSLPVTNYVLESSNCCSMYFIQILYSEGETGQRVLTSSYWELGLINLVSINKLVIAAFPLYHILSPLLFVFFVVH